VDKGIVMDLLRHKKGPKIIWIQSGIGPFPLSQPWSLPPVQRIMMKSVRSTSDAMIAATAIHEGLKLSTRNKKHFARIQGLDIDAPDY